MLNKEKQRAVVKQSEQAIRQSSVLFYSNSKECAQLIGFRSGFGISVSSKFLWLPNGSRWLFSLINLQRGLQFLKRMILNKKVQKLIMENDIQKSNYTLVIRLKKIIEQLNLKILEQDRVIQGFKKDVKTTKINEMEIEIQHLNDQNKRLLLLLQDHKNKHKNSCILSPKKAYNHNKYEERKPIHTEIKYETKVYDLLKENQQLKKELLTHKVNQNILKKRKSTINDRNSIFIQKNLIDFQKLNQKKMDLEAEKALMGEKIKKLEAKVTEMGRRNQQLERIHHRHLEIESSFK